MARRRGRSRITPDDRPGFDVVVRARPRLPSLQLVEDRRLWHPERVFRPALSFRKAASRVVVAPPKSRLSTIPSRVAFAIPRKVAICVRRKQRKEVLHALGKAGGGKRRRPRRNYWSGVNC